MFFKKTKQIPDPEPRSFFAWNVERAGDFLLFVESGTSYYEFIYLPGQYRFFLSKDSFHKALATNVISFVQQIPPEIYEETLLYCPADSGKVIIDETNTKSEQETEYKTTNQTNRPFADVSL